MKPEKFDLKNSGPFTPAEAAKQVQLASKQLKGFQLWHPHLHVAHATFSLENIPYPIAKQTIPKGVVISRLEGIRGVGLSAKKPGEFVHPFRTAHRTLAKAANISMSLVLFETTSKKCPVGIHTLKLEADQGKGMRLQACYLHDTPTVERPPKIIRQELAERLGGLARERWVLLNDDPYLVFPGSVRRAQSKVEIAFPVGEFDELENILADLLKILGQPKRTSWWVRFVSYFGNQVFYGRILDSAGRWFHFPKPEVLKATGLTGDAAELIKLVNEAEFPSTTANLKFQTSFRKLTDVQPFFELAVRSEEIDRSVLAMFQTEKGVLAQLDFGTTRAGKVALKVLYPQRGGFGWEDAYEKLRRGEKLIPEP